MSQVVDASSDQGWDADHAVTTLYSLHYRSLVRLAAVLVRDLSASEQIVQDSFVAMHTAWRRLADSDRALSFLRRAVVSRSRSVQLHGVIAGKLAPTMAHEIPGAAHEGITLLEGFALVAMLQTLPPRQREVLVLRYYADLSEAQIASAVGIRKGAVERHAARAMSTLHAELGSAIE
jgi:DNA-directed RNA polymerase specialized sigma24 family protein